MFSRTDDVRIRGLRPLLPPAILLDEQPLDDDGATRVHRARSAAAGIIDGNDDRLLVVVGPCSIHDVDAAVEYAERLKEAAARFADDLFLVMRVYFEKPRTTVGWKGLINDPHLDGTFRINAGLRMARGLLRELVSRDVPVGTEFLDVITPQYNADLVTWGAIGARTTESQLHRELASGLSMPVGFKNGTGGSVKIAVDAIRAARHPHHFLSVTKQGISAIVSTEGNPHCHVILRGGNGAPNYSAEHVEQVVALHQAAEMDPRVMIDCSHANSGKKAANQPGVAQSIAEQVSAGQRAIRGVMIESHLVGGRQNWDADNATYGQSITDECLAFDDTLPVLETLASAARTRRGGA